MSTTKANEKFFFDVNIWIFIFSSIGCAKNYQKQYSKILKVLQNHKSEIYISSLVLGEYLNVSIAVALEEYNNSTRAGFKKKQFRNTSEYKNELIVIRNEVSKILKVAKLTDDLFDNIDLNNILQDLDSSDYNDAYYSQLSKLKDYTIVTDDGDFEVATKEL